MKIIDLLNKIANGEEVPNKIKVHNTEYHKCILKTGIDYKIYSDDFYYLSNDICKAGFSLNDEVEILEEEKKIPEKLENGYTKQSIVDMKEARFNSNDMAKICNRIGWLMENRNELSNKIDEIIDYLKSKGDE